MRAPNFETPSERAAVTKSAFRTSMTAPRVMRAICGQPKATRMSTSVQTVRFVRNIGTIRCSSMCRTGTPDWSNADSNVNEQPRRNATKSSRHSPVMSETSAVSWPSR